MVINMKCKVCGKSVKAGKSYCSDLCEIDAQIGKRNYKYNVGPMHKLKMFRDMRLKVLSEVNK